MAHRHDCTAYHSLQCTKPFFQGSDRGLVLLLAFAPERLCSALQMCFKVHILAKFMGAARQFSSLSTANKEATIFKLDRKQKTVGPTGCTEHFAKGFYSKQERTAQKHHVITKHVHRMQGAIFWHNFCSDDARVYKQQRFAKCCESQLAMSTASVGSLENDLCTQLLPL